MPIIEELDIPDMIAEYAERYKISIRKRHWILIQNYIVSSNTIERVFRIRWPGEPFRQKGFKSKEKATLAMARLVSEIKKAMGLSPDRLRPKVVQSEIWTGWQIFYEDIPLGTKFDKGIGKKGKSFPNLLYQLPPCIFFNEDDALKAFIGIVEYWQDMKLKHPAFPARLSSAGDGYDRSKC